MTDERGGRYFREARFFLAGDKVVAQSHIIEARGLMGYMRDMHAMGGPAIQVKYATLQDGTQIKATMMNGQYQAEIVSPAPTLRRQRGRVLTIVGDEHIGLTQNFGWTTKAIKWQERTGVVELPRGGYSFSYATQVSYDGDLVLGGLYNMDPTLGRVGVRCLWDGSGGYTVLPDYDTTRYLRDIAYGDTDLIAVPYAPDSDYDLYRHRFIAGDRDHLFMGLHSVAGVSGAMAVERLAVDGSEAIVLFEDPPPMHNFSYVYGGSESGNTLIGIYPGDGQTGPYAYLGERVVLWERPDRSSAYVARVIPGITNIAAPSISFDGRTVLAEVERPRFLDGGDISVIDNVPAIYTDEHGILKLIEFDPAPIANQYTQAYGIKVSSDGRAAIGGYYVGVAPYSLAWQEINVEDATFSLIDELSDINHRRTLYDIN